MRNFQANTPCFPNINEIPNRKSLPQFKSIYSYSQTETRNFERRAQYPITI